MWVRPTWFPIIGLGLGTITNTRPNVAPDVGTRPIGRRRRKREEQRDEGMRRRRRKEEGGGGLL